MSPPPDSEEDAAAATVNGGPAARDSTAACRPPVEEETASASPDLVERLRSGEEVALQELYQLYSPTVYGLALRMLGEPADAEEVVVDILLKAWTSIESFDGERGTLECWLLIMTRSRILDRLRRRNRREKAMEKASAGGALLADTNGGGPGSAVSQLDCRREVSALLEVLTDTQRTAIELAYFGGMTQAEIAAEIEAPLGTVKSRIRSGMKRLCDVHRNGNGKGGEGA